MSVLFYVYALIVISAIVAVGGAICESSAVLSVLGSAKKYVYAFCRSLAFALMIPAFLIFRAAGAMGMIRR